MIVLTWNELMNTVLLLPKELWGRKVYGIPRGGTLIATLLSYQGCELVLTPPRSPRDDVIIVDDIADDGTTLGRWAKRDFQTLALFVRKWCDPLPDICGRTISEEGYIALPYESFAEASAMEKKGDFRSNG